MMTIHFLSSIIDFGWLKKSFLCFSLGTLLFIPTDLLFFSSKIKPSPSSGISAAGNKPQPFSKPLESLAHYEEIFQKSALFGTYSSQGALPVLSSSIAELTKDYRLKGVMILDTPEAILEDARTQQTTFVKTGDKLGDLTVKEIREGVLVLSYYGEEKELRIS